jgi:hypothetical protein
MNPEAAAAAIAAASAQICDALESFEPAAQLPSPVVEALASLLENLGLAFLPSELHVKAASWHLESLLEPTP